MLRHWMGDTVEQAIRKVGADRDRVRKYIWECKCRNRKKHYYEVAVWADGVLASEDVALHLAGLEEILAKGAK